MPRASPRPAGDQDGPILDPAGIADLIATRDVAFDVLSDERRRSIYLHVKQSPGPVTVNEVADTFAIHRNAAKFHLDKLLDAGLLDATFKRVNGRRGPGAGRPSKLYAATDTEVTFSVPERHYDLLAHLLLKALTSGNDLDTVGEAFGHEVARAVGPAPAGDPIDHAAGVLERLGFDPQVEREADGSAWITTSNCPFGRVAMDAPGAEVCRLDRAIIRGILDHFEAGSVEVCERASLRRGHDVCVREIRTI